MSDPQPRHPIMSRFYYVPYSPDPCGLPEAERKPAATPRDEANHPVGRRVNPLRGSSTAFRPSR